MFSKESQKKLYIIEIYSAVFLFHFLVLFIISYIVSDKVPKFVNENIDIAKYIPIQDLHKEKNLAKPKDEGLKDGTDDSKQVVKESERIYSEGDEFGQYLPQFRVSEMPIFPTSEIKSRVVYPPLANKQGLEGLVILELFIDAQGNIKKISVLKNPGYGFADAAIKALHGIKCQPAKVEGTPVPVRFRYPVRFELKK